MGAPYAFIDISITYLKKKKKASSPGAFAECDVKLSYGYYAALGTVRKHLII